MQMRTKPRRWYCNRRLLSPFAPRLMTGVIRRSRRSVRKFEWEWGSSWWLIGGVGGHKLQGWTEQTLENRNGGTHGVCLVLGVMKRGLASVQTRRCRRFHNGEILCAGEAIGNPKWHPFAGGSMLQTKNQ